MDKTALRFVSAFDTIDELVFCGLMLALPFGWQAAIIPNILFLILLARKAIWEYQRPSKAKVLYFAPILLFLFINLLSLVYSSHAGYGADAIFKRLNLFIVPIGFLFVDFNPQLARRGLRFFILGSLLASLISLVIAFSQSLLIKDQMLCIAPFFGSMGDHILDTDIHNNRFFGVNYSFFMHPAYFGLYMAIAFMGLLNSYAKEAKSWIIQKGGVLGLLFIGLSLGLLSTNGMLLVSSFIVIYTLVYATVKKQMLDIFSSWLVVFAIVLSIGLYFNPQTTRVITGDTPVTSLSQKKMVTEASLEVIQENIFFGVGLGDLDDALTEVYLRKGYTQLAEDKTNPHNQFLQTFASLGLVGLLSLLWLFFSLFKHGFQNKSLLLWGIAIVTIIAFSFESMLNRYWGILGFGLFYGLFYFFPIDIESEDGVSGWTK